MEYREKRKDKAKYYYYIKLKKTEVITQVAIKLIIMRRKQIINNKINKRSKSTTCKRLLTEIILFKPTDITLRETRISSASLEKN